MLISLFYILNEEKKIDQHNIKINIVELVNNKNISIYLFTFLISLYPKWFGFAVILIILERLFYYKSFDLSNILHQFEIKKSTIWIFSFFLMHLVGLSSSKNIDFGWMDIGMKSTFFIFPLLFTLFPFKVNWNIFTNIFISGALVSVIVSFLIATYKFYKTSDVSGFYGEFLNPFIHRGYWAVYLLVAYFLTLNLRINSFVNETLRGLSILLLVSGIILSGSKIAIVLLLVVSLITILKKLYYAKKWIMILLFFMIAGLFLWMAPSFTPQFLKEKFKKTTHTTINPQGFEREHTMESTEARILMWETSLELIKENPIWGVGTGDIKDELKKRNLEKKYQGVARKNFNSHNQYLNTQLALGIFGTIFLLGMFIIPFIFTNGVWSFEKRMIIFILLCAMLTESFLETQAGIIPVAFLLSLFSLDHSKKKEVT